MTNKDYRSSKAKKRVKTISLVLVFLGIVLLIISLATPYWRGTDSYHEGVFQKCPGRCEDVVLFDGQDAEIDAVRIIMLISLGYIIISIFLSAFSITNRDVITFLRALSFAHVVVALSVYTIFMTEMDKFWGFYVGWVGGGLYGMGFLLRTVALHCMKDEEKEIDENGDKI